MTLSTIPCTYRIVDTKTGRFYVGSTINLKTRWSHHVYRFSKGTHPNPIMQAIWNDDADRLTCEIVDELPDAGRDELLEAEQALLDAAEVGKNRMCMNILAIAGSHLGRKRPPETVEKLRLINKGRIDSAETKEKQRQAKLGRPLSAEHRRKIGDAVRGKPGPSHTPEMLTKLRKHSMQVAEQLRALVANGTPVVQAGRMLGVARGSARRIVKGESYTR